MGSGIAEVCARAGVPGVTVLEVDQDRLNAGRSRIEESFAKAAAAGKLSEEDRNRALDRIQFTTEYTDLGRSDLVIEAVVEDEAEKVQVFGLLDKVIESETAILAT